MKKRVYRTRKPNKIIGGVCGGIGEYFDIDPLFLRLSFLILLLMTPITPVIFISYVVAWMITPVENIDNPISKEV